MTARNSPVKVQIVQVDENGKGQRIDNFLMPRLKGVPKSRIYRIIRKGEVRVNGKRVKPEHKLKLADKVRIPPVRTARSTTVTPSEELIAVLQQSILFEDEDMLVINKPAGLAVHRGSGVSISVIDVLRSLYAEQYLELVHRLDKGTSGCLLLARNARSLKLLQEAFRQRETAKEYHALVHGLWPQDLHQISAGLQRGPENKGDRRVYVSRDGKQAETGFELLSHFHAHSLLLARPVTGRTHQIRVHASFAGYPLCGDQKYSSPEQRQSLRKLGINRLCLHAHGLSLKHPVSGKTLQFRAPYDDSFAAAVACLSALK